MSTNQYTCPSCATVLKTGAPVNPGTLIKCPKCAKVFPVPGAAARPPAAAAPVAPRPVPPPAPAPAAAPRPAAAAPIASRPMAPPSTSGTMPMPAPTGSLSETTAMPTPRKPSLLGRLPRKLRKYVIQGMGVAAAFSALFYFIFFLVAFNALDNAVSKIKTPTSEDGDNSGDPVTQRKKKLPLHLAYLHQDFTGIQTIRPDRFTRSSLLRNLPIDEMSDKLLEKSGIDARKSDLMVTYFDPYPAGVPMKAGQVAEWADFTPPDGGFTATFPGKPRRNLVPRKLGSTEKMTVYQSHLSGTFLNNFQVELVELSNDEVTQGAQAAFRDDVQRAQFLAHKITDVTLDGSPGKEMSNEADPKGRVITRKRIYLVGKRLIRVLAEGDKGQIKSADLARFLDSFKLVPFKGDSGDDATEFADGTPFSWGVVMHFSQAVDGKAILKKALEDTKEVTYQGKTYLRSQKEKADNVSMCGALPDDQTVLLAPEPTLRKMLMAGDSVQNALTEKLDLLELDSPYSTVMLVDQYSAKVSETMREVKGQVPQQLAGLRPILDVPERTKTFAMTIDPDRPVMLKMTAEQADASTAESSRKAVQQAYDAAKGLYALLGKDLVAKDLPADLRDPVLKMIDSLLENVKTETDGKNLVISIKRPDGLEEVLKKSRPLIKEKMNAP